jgi:hypothetical protein
MVRGVAVINIEWSVVVGLEQVIRVSYSGLGDHGVLRTYRGQWRIKATVLVIVGLISTS